MIKIIGGEYRSRQLLAPEDEAVSRPYAARVKESLFNLLRGWFDQTTVIDLFAGVGTMGLEAISRGAKQAFLVERDRRIFELLQSNIRALGCDDRAMAVSADVLSMTWMPRAPRPADLIFVDPPYRLMEDERTRRMVLEMIERCQVLMGDQGFVVLRSPVSVADADFTVPGFHGPEPHSYGNDMHVLLYSPAKGGGQSH
jgi:16S rRNA (guanine(966)-N(2))-methyltransferase RsmD